MTLAIGVLLALWVAVENCDPSITDTGADAGADTGAGAGTGADTDAGTEADAGPEALSPHEREEAAKDELGRAREALERGDLAEAAAALERASTFDSDNPDVDELREEILAAQPDAG
jgi:hypothetical protein